MSRPTPVRHFARALAAAGARRARRARGADGAPLLDPDDWRELEQALRTLCARPPRRVGHPRESGDARIVLRGSGVDYAQSRAYQPGDDLRAMHWALLARTGRPYVREYEQEHAAPWHVLVDAQGSMLFGTRRRTKAAQAARAAVLAAGLQAAQSPRSPLACSLWSSAGLQQREFGCGMDAARRLAAWLMAQRIEPPLLPRARAGRAAPELGAWAASLARRRGQPCRLWLCSDFAWLDGAASDALRPLAAAPHCCALQVLDTVELELPEFETVAMVDAATASSGMMPGGPAARRAFAQAAEQLRLARHEQMRALGMRVAQLRADADAVSLHGVLAGYAT